MNKKQKLKSQNSYQQKGYLIPLLLAVFAFVLYANTIPNDYNLDDELVTRDHRLTKQGISAIPEIFTSPYYEDAMGYRYEYRPVALSLFALEISLFGENSHVSHFINVLLYAGTAVLLFLTMSLLFSQYNLVLPLLISLLFIAHPLHTEVVASIKNREELLCFLGGISALYFAIKYVSKRNLLFLLAFFICFTLGALSKRSMLSFAVIIPIGLIYFQPVQFRQLLFLSLPVAVLIAIMSPFFFLRDKILIALGIIVLPQLILLLRNRFDIVRNFALMIKNWLGKTFRSFLKLIRQIFQRVLAMLNMLWSPIKATAGWGHRRLSHTQAGFRQIIQANDFIERLTKIVDFIPMVMWILLGILGVGICLLAIYFSKPFVIALFLFLISIFYLAQNENFRKGLLLYQTVLIGSAVIIYQIIFIPALVSPLLFYLILHNRSFRKIAVFSLCLFLVLAWTMPLNRLFLVIMLLIYFDFKGWKKVLRILLLVAIPLFLTELYGFTVNLFTLNYRLLSVSGYFFLWLLYLDKVKRYARPIFLFVLISFTYGLTIYKTDNSVKSKEYQRIIQLKVKEISTRYHLWYGAMIIPPPPAGPLASLDTSSLISVDTSLSFPDTLSRKVSPLKTKPKGVADSVPPSTTGLTINSPAPQILPATYRQLEFVENPLSQMDDPSKEIGTSLYVLGEYLRLMIFPHPLSYYYGYKKIPIKEFQDPLVIFWLVIYLLLIALILLLHAKYPVISFGILSYCIAIFLFSNLISPVAGLLGERLAYTATLGFCIVAGYILCLLFKVDLRSPLVNFSLLNNKLKYAVLVILLLYSGKTFARNLKWTDPLTLFRNDISHLENSAQAHNLLASNLIVRSYQINNGIEKKKLIDEAIPHYKKAVEIEPKFFNAWYDLARSYSSLQDYDNALKAYLKVVELDSTFTNATLQAAVILDQQGKSRQAEKLYKQIIRLEPQKIETYTNLSFLYFKAGKYEASIDINKEAIASNPEAYEPYVNIGKTFYNMGDIGKAEEFLEKAHKLNPGDKQLTLFLSEINKQLGDQEKAEFYRKKAAQLN